MPHTKPGCPSRKVCYDSQLAANTAMLLLWQKRMRAGQAKMERRAYKCGRCPHWHLTSRNDERPARLV